MNNLENKKTDQKAKPPAEHLVSLIMQARTRIKTKMGDKSTLEYDLAFRRLVDHLNAAYWELELARTEIDQIVERDPEGKDAWEFIDTQIRAAQDDLDETQVAE